MNDRQLHLWCLIDTRSNKIVEGLYFDEVRAIVSTLDSEVLNFWYAWRDDWAEWRSVSKVDGINETIRRSLSIPLPPAPSVEPLTSAKPVAEMPVAQEPVDEIVEMSLVVQEEDLEESAGQPEVGTASENYKPRGKVRFKKRYAVLLEIGGQTFQSHTHDISVGGMLLENPIPMWVGGHFKVRIVKPNSKKQIELKCSLVRKDGETEDRFRIKILPLENIEDEKRLEFWLAA